MFRLDTKQPLCLRDSSSLSSFLSPAYTMAVQHIKYTLLGVEALKFLNPPSQVLSGFIGMNIDVNCSTNDPYATVQLFHSRDFVTYTERTLSPEKLHLNKQVFTLLNLGVKDSGQYKCKATDGQQTIEWPSSHGFLFLSQGKLPDIIFDPPRPITVQQGQTGNVTCQTVGWSVSKLLWKKRSNSGDQTVPDSKVVHVIDKTENMVKAVLTITNAQTQDSGEYKCVLSAFNKQDYKIANIRVDGVEAFKFLNTPSQVLSGFLGMNIDFNCSTNDPYATVQLFHSKDFATYTERTLSPEKLHLNKQVFTLLNLDVKDAGQYKCKATDGQQTIEWPSSHGFLFLSQEPLLIMGDFNIHVDVVGDPVCTRFLDLLEVMDQLQHVTTPTHESGHTLDLIITRQCGALVKDPPVRDCHRSDHWSVTCLLNLDKPIITRKTKTFRKIKNIDTAALPNELAALDLCSYTPDDLNDLVHCYNTTLASALDRHAPLVTRSIPVRPLVPWFNNDIKVVKKERRKAERIWRRTSLLSDLRSYKDLRNKTNNLMTEARRTFYRELVDENCGDQKRSFSTHGQMLTNNIYPEVQSSYRVHHSTETALLKVMNDVLLKMNSQHVSLLILLDLSAAFDTVDHFILLDRLTKVVGLQGMEAFKFLNIPSQVLSGFLGMNIDFNCSTNDPYATVQLFHSKDFATYTERTLSPEKLHLNKQVFTLLNLDVKDAGQYICKATEGQQTIEWPSSHGLLFLSRGKLPDIILDPPRPIIVQRGQTGNVTCQTVGWSVSKLLWKKRSNSGDQTVPDSKVVHVIDKTENMVKAVLTLTNAQTQDSGEYKCVLTAFNKQDYKIANIRVDGVEAFKFLNTPSQVLSGFLGMNIDINCSTNDPYATVQLFHSKDFATYTERTLCPEKLHLNKQVFTLLNLDVKDAGQYNCKATDRQQTIEWPSSHGLLFLSQVSKLLWKKRSNSGDQTVPDSKVVHVIDKTENMVKAVLTITNAQTQDSGEYKCVLTAFSKQDYKIANIRVDGNL
ncbi:Leucine-rich repeats and immunoglobulin-like domains protein 2 [Stylophora pistillata]|uniref:Leucine-rich repeats and immunoglobulin-like domains protein 2 n=1 Tax=Stylophora pistillata TaxID=50429 RepID=A0A2B4RXH2_STYPI|nr:Leucine-rich repeats and immunoglobulin-like domains protein 2 [Stylophora pistillata]